MQTQTQSSQEKTEISKTVLQETSKTYLRNSFFHFFYYGWSVAIKRIDGRYVTPGHLVDITRRLMTHNRTSTIGPRFHLKSTILEAFVAWKLYRMARKWNEWMYMSYTSELGAYHTKRIKRHIAELPELFGDYKDLTDSEGVLYYAYGDRKFHCEPEGILTAKRGKHPHGLAGDDILKDPDNVMNVEQLQKIERKFFEEVESMPTDELHLVGTPQDEDDLFAKLERKKMYDCKRYDAIVDEAKQIAWWPQRYPYDILMEIKDTIGIKAFNKEFRARPVRGEDGYIKPARYDELTWSRLKNYPLGTPVRLKEYTYAGFDIGKKTHPSHLAVFAEDRKHRLVQVHSKFMDGWDYVDQLEYLSQAVKQFNITSLCYDDTRAEFESFREEGKLPDCMEGIVFRAANKYSMATELDRMITQGMIRFLKDDRQKRQILSVDNDLQSISTRDGHGDAFFSIILAIRAFKAGDMVNIRSLDDLISK